jgi:hypothetical protein
MVAAASPVLVIAVRGWLRAIDDVLPREPALMAALEVLNTPCASQPAQFSAPTSSHN